jgi:hypothetical protein
MRQRNKEMRNGEKGSEICDSGEEWNKEGDGEGEGSGEKVGCGNSEERKKGCMSVDVQG